MDYQRSSFGGGSFRYCHSEKITNGILTVIILHMFNTLYKVIFSLKKPLSVLYVYGGYKLR